MNEAYLITNIENLKKYVGVTSQGYKNRWKSHLVSAKRGDHCILYNDIRKFGEDKFKVELLESRISDEERDLKEKYYIQKYDTFYENGSGYNMTEGGKGILGYHHTEETRKKLSEICTGRKYPKERNERIRQSMLGREYKQEWKDSLSKSRMGRFTKEKNPFYGKHHSEETKRKISKCNSKHKVLRIDYNSHDVLQIFDNQSQAGKWVVDSRLSKASPSTCAGRIGQICNTYDDYNHTAYGFIWMFEKGQSTN